MSHSAPNPSPQGRWGQQAAQDAQVGTPPSSPPTQPAQPAPPFDSYAPQSQTSGSWGGSVQQQPAPQLSGYASGQPPRPTTAPFTVDILHNKWVVTGIATVLGILFVISYFMTWATLGNGIAEINGLGFMDVQSGEADFIGNLYMIPALIILFLLGDAAYHIGFSSEKNKGYTRLFVAGGFAAAYAIYALASKMLIKLFFDDFGTGYLDTIDAETGPGAAMCLFIALLTLVTAGVLYGTRKYVRTGPIGGPTNGQPYPPMRSW